MGARILVCRSGLNLIEEVMKWKGMRGITGPITALQRRCRIIMFSVMSVCQLFCPRGFPCDHYPWCIGPQHTGIPIPGSLLKMWDLTVQGPWPQSPSPTNMGPHCTGPQRQPSPASACFSAKINLSSTLVESTPLKIWNPHRLTL